MIFLSCCYQTATITTSLDSVVILGGEFLGGTEMTDVAAAITESSSVNEMGEILLIN